VQPVAGREPLGRVEREVIEELARRYFSELVQREEDETDAAAPQLKERVELVLEQSKLFEGAAIVRDWTVLAAKLDPRKESSFTIWPGTGTKRWGIASLWSLFISTMRSGSSPISPTTIAASRSLPATRRRPNCAPLSYISGRTPTSSTSSGLLQSTNCEIFFSPKKAAAVVSAAC
jgi:hypothetical protein